MLFKSAKAEVDNPLNCFSGLLSLCRGGYGKRSYKSLASCDVDEDKVEGMRQRFSFCYRKNRVRVFPEPNR